MGKVDILINNAGYLEQLAHIDSSDPEGWWKTWEVNVKGVYLMTKFFLPLLLKSDLKTVVVVSSVGAHITMPGMSAYQTTKLAVLRLNDFLMAEYGEKGLLAFGVHPGVSCLTQFEQRSVVMCMLTDTGRSDRISVDYAEVPSRYLER